MTHHLCIKNWPDSVEPPGPFFDLKKLDSKELKLLLGGDPDNPVDDTSDPVVVPTIVRWPDGESTMPVIILD